MGVTLGCPGGGGTLNKADKPSKNLVGSCYSSLVARRTTTEVASRAFWKETNVSNPYAPAEGSARLVLANISKAVPEVSGGRPEREAVRWRRRIDVWTHACRM